MTETVRERVTYRDATHKKKLFFQSSAKYRVGESKVNTRDEFKVRLGAKTTIHANLSTQNVRKNKVISDPPSLLALSHFCKGSRD